MIAKGRKEIPESDQLEDFSSKLPTMIGSRSFSWIQPK